MAHSIKFSNFFAFRFLNFSQFCSVLNDNLFKFLTIYLLISLKGKEQSSEILLWCGFCFIVPFLLFSSIGGLLADCISKQRIILFLKALEIFIILLGMTAYFCQSIPWCYITIFCLSSQSAFLSPSKFSIIPELLHKEQISKANGIITAFSYFAVISGTFLASFLIQITHRNFIAALSWCLFIAIIGFLLSFGIPYTPPPITANQLYKRLSLRQFFTQSLQIMRLCQKTPNLFISIIGSVIFLFVGSFVQINIIPFAMNFLHLSEVNSGYLFLGTAIGISIGSLLAGRLCKKEPNLGISCLALILLINLFVLLPICTYSITGTIFCLIFLGIAGGLYIIPLESYIQSFSPIGLRGQIIGLTSFLNFLGALGAPCCLFFFEKIAHVSSDHGFFFMAIILAITFLFVIQYVFLQFMHFLTHHCIQFLYNLHFMNYPLTSKFQENRIAICHVLKNPYKNFFVLLGEFPKAHLCIVRNKPKIKDKFISCFKEISLFYLYEHNDDLSLKKLINNLSPYKNIIFLFPSHLDYLKFQRTPLFIQLQLDFYYQMKNFHLRNVSHFPYKWTLFKRTQLTFQFTSLPLMQDKKDLLDKEVPLPSKLSSDELSTDEVASQIF